MAHPPVTIYRTQTCPYCSMAARLFERRGVVFSEIYLDGKTEERAALQERTQFRTVPQIFIGERFVGGYSDVAALEANGELDQLLAG
jgi:glutaredoxin 3